MENDELLRCLQAITGDAVDWDGLDLSAWCETQGEDSEEIKSADAIAESEDVYYSSDDSADMIMNLHKLTPAEKAQIRGGKLNKARQYASEEVGFPRKVAELEKIKWDETGLAVGDVSAEGVFFVSWRLVENYPDMFVGKTNGARVSGSASPSLAQMC